MEHSPAKGYRGIWYSIGQDKGYGPKYSGGLGTYPANMVPMAIYDEGSDQTFFVYGGTSLKSQKDLQIMIGRFDHRSERLGRPITLRDSKGFEDAHANPSIGIDAEGHLFVFSATRHKFEGRIYRSVKPRDPSAFEVVYTGYLAYPQPWPHPERGWVLLHTRYNDNNGERYLYSQRSSDGITWDEPIPYATFQGHYQNSVMGREGWITTAFNTHPGGVDHRTQIYVLRTKDGGLHWQTMGGAPLPLPLEDPNNPALVLDAKKEGDLVYIMDVALTSEGEPVVLYVSSKNAAAGPQGGERIWKTLCHNTNYGWRERSICSSDHNYDCGNLLIEEGVWTVIGPTGPGCHGAHTGGEMERWVSTDEGNTWVRTPMTQNSLLHHVYAKKATPSHPDFQCFWADGNPLEASDSQLYFSNAKGEVFLMPREMEDDWMPPVSLSR